MKNNSLDVWLMAARPKTLIATIAPILVGASLAIKMPDASKTNVVIAALAALFIQIGTNLSNDYFDFIKGSDRSDRVGPVRVTQSGLIAPGYVRLAFVVCFLLSAFLGAYLVFEVGFVIFVVGVLSIMCGIAYTGGPFPIAYLGLGEIFVLLFFGPIASGYTYYVATHQYLPSAFVLGLAPGLISCAILVTNNLRDIVQDKKSQKRTLAVRFGRKFSQIEYIALWAFAFLVLFVVSISEANFKLLFPLATVPLVTSLCIQIWNYEHPVELIKVLEGTAKVFAIFTVLLCFGMYL